MKYVGKKQVMSVKKFQASFFSRKSAAGILEKNEVFATVSSSGASFSFLQVSFCGKKKCGKNNFHNSFLILIYRQSIKRVLFLNQFQLFPSRHLFDPNFFF